MNPTTRRALELVLRCAPTTRRRDQRGDVPGWVLVTVMTAGLVGALYALAKPQLSDMLSAALNSVH
ncbi:MAG TPA: hypothetical protein VHW64_06800 [Nocardioides sp.]|uniref:hypothetical protein n=1 Tax=Nocardioides sp. TaxID=35761 RepID=UPI002E36C56C|nr:hypothetical protein [Nocardioides sp.]HEX3930395.1 hypothetical protein [Nocardioides sp.]